MKTLQFIFLFFIFVSCKNTIDVKSNKQAVPAVSTLSAEVFPNQILDGQQLEISVKLTSVAVSDQNISWQVFDEDGNSPTAYFVATQGSGTLLSGQDHLSLFLTSMPASVATGTKEFNVRITGAGVSNYKVGTIKVRSTAENPTEIDTVSIVNLENNGYANIGNQTSYNIDGVCSYSGGNVLVTVSTVTKNATCAADNTWATTLNLSTLSTQGTLTIHAIHSGANVPGSADRQIIRDSVAPSVAITTNTSTVVSLSTQNAFSLTGPCLEGSNVNLSITSSGGAGTVTDVASCSAGNWLRAVNVSTLPDGILTVSAAISDLAGNSVNQQKNFTKNTVAPTIAIISPTVSDTAMSANYTTQVVSGTCNKNGATIALSGDVSGTLTGTCNGTNFSISNLTITGGDGFKAIYATMTDTYGNTAYANTVLNKHISLPTAVLAGVPAATSPQQTLNVTVGGMGVNQYKYKLGDNTLDCTVSGGYGLTTNISTSIGDDLLADGNKKLCVLAIDTYGNMQALAGATAYSWVKDTTAPTVAITGPAVNTYANVNAGSQIYTAFLVSGDCGIEGTNNVTIQGNIQATKYANCTSGHWSTTVDFTPASQGAVFILASQENPANGNIGQDSRIFLKDTVLPTIDIQTPAANSYINRANYNASNGGFRLTGNCNEYIESPGTNIKITGGTGIVNVACTGSTWMADVPFANNTDATATVTVEITDVAGNKQTASRSFIQDTTLPAVAVTATMNGSYVNIANKAAYTISGTCSSPGVGKVVVTKTSGGTSITGGTTDCLANNTWSANLDLSSGATFPDTPGSSFSLTVTLTESGSTNVQTSTVSLIKDTVAPTIAVSSPLANVCVTPNTLNTFTISGTCTDTDGLVNITSTPTAQLGGTITQSCSGGVFSKTLTLSNSGLNNTDPFTLSISQTDIAGNSQSNTRQFKYINSAPAVTFGGWKDVYAVGKKTYFDGNASEAGIVKISWNDFPTGSNTCIPDGVKIYRAATSGTTTSSEGNAVSSVIPTTTTTFTDSTLTASDFSKLWYYGMKAEIGEFEAVVSMPAAIKEIRVMAPPDNMALVHRWIANQEVCGLMGKTTDPNNNYRCAFTGQGNVGGYNDLQWDMLFDRFELGCKPTNNCGAEDGSGTTACVASANLNRDNPNSSGGIPAPIGAVYYQNLGLGSYGQCWYKVAAGATTGWKTLNDSANVTAVQLGLATTSQAHAVPVAYVQQSRVVTACNQQQFDFHLIDTYADNAGTPNGAAEKKRLSRQKEWRAAAAWSPTLTNSNIITMENGGGVGRCNTNNDRNTLGLNGTVSGTRQFLLGYDTHGGALETGSKVSTANCQSRYGIQDLVGNLYEWASDQITCDDNLGYSCHGVASGANTADSTNNDMVGFLFDGQNLAGHGPGDRRALSDGTYTVDSWALDSATRNGTTYYNPVLGLPLMANDNGGSVLIADWITASLFHGDYFYLSPANGAANPRGLLLGGRWNGGALYGRWLSNWLGAASSTSYNGGGRCALPVR
jgi:hypothetical protein